MNIKFRNYENDTRFGQDYYKVCDFLVRIDKGKMVTPNFQWGRWVWMISRPVDNENQKNRIGIWEDDGEIVALATFELNFREAFICIDCSYNFLFRDILIYAKKSLSIDGNVKVIISDSNREFQSIAF